MFYKILIRALLIYVTIVAEYPILAQGNKSEINDSTTQSTKSEEPIKDVTVPSGTKFKISITTQLATNRNVEGSTFSATIAEDFIFEGDTISAKNSQVIGKIVESKSGKGIGDAKLSIQITEITVNNKLMPVDTNPITVKAERRRNAEAEIPSGTIEEVKLAKALQVEIRK
jgi:hypothetical protein